MLGDTVWFANSGGLVQGWDLSGLTEGGTPTRTFRFWVGDDTDATVVVERAAELIERRRSRRGRSLRIRGTRRTRGTCGRAD